MMETGCETGTTTLKLAPGVARLVAREISREVIAIARPKALAQPCRSAALRIGSADHPDGAVLAFNLLHLVPGRVARRRRLIAG